MRAGIPDNPLLLFSRARGTSGNTLRAYSDGTNVSVTSTILSGGAAASEVVSYSNSLSCAVNGTYPVHPVSYTDEGSYYEGDVWFSISGVDVVDQVSNVARFSVSGIFTGYEPCAEFIEVANLSGILSAGGVDSSGILDLVWDDMTAYRGTQTRNTAGPYQAGAQTQQTVVYSGRVHLENILYYIFIWIANTGQTSPEQIWPRVADSKGIWYFAGRTSRTSKRITLAVPSGTHISIWTGFGNPSTLATTRTPIGRISPLIV
jgi:hypothetical protein